MRINEEIDALESMGIRPVEYLVDADCGGDGGDHPLYSIAVILSFVASQFTTVVLFGQSGGCMSITSTRFEPDRPVVELLQAVLMAITILLIHTYFGYFATGGLRGGGGGG